MPPVGAELFHADDRRTQTNTKEPIAAFLNFGNGIKNSTFCPHSVFMCFVWISEQTAIISLHSIN